MQNTNTEPTVEVRMNDEYTDNDDYEIAIIGAGGIGSNLAPPLIQALHRGALIESVGIVNIRIYDSDRVEESNLSHQRFTPADIGKHKVEAIKEAMEPFESDRLKIHACPWDVRSLDDMTPPDLTVAAVDSPQARMIVHDSEGLWLDCRCRGASTITLDFRVDDKMVDDLTPEDQEPASCQLPGALESGNIQFGYMAAATHAAQWVMQCLRYILGEERAVPPLPQAKSLTTGTMGFLPMKREQAPPEPRENTRPHRHPDEVIDHCIGSGDHDSAPIRETIAALAMDGDHQQVWDISDRMSREVSILVDNEGLVWVDVGSSGDVQLSPPKGSTLPYRSWWHTHPRSSEDPYDDSDCYWSSTDLDALANFSGGILLEALVLGHSHYKRAEVGIDQTVEALGDEGPLSDWSSEPPVPYESEVNSV